MKLEIEKVENGFILQIDWMNTWKPSENKTIHGNLDSVIKQISHILHKVYDPKPENKKLSKP